jgi:hypothetical protein
MIPSTTRVAHAIGRERPLAISIPRENGGRRICISRRQVKPTSIILVPHEGIRMLYLLEPKVVVVVIVVRRAAAFLRPLIGMMPQAEIAILPANFDLFAMSVDA